MLSNFVNSACRLSPSFFQCIGVRRSSLDQSSSEYAPTSIARQIDEVDSGGGGSTEVMVYSLGWGMGEPERRGADRKRAQPAPAQLSPDDGHEVDVLPLHNQVGGHTRLLVLNDSTVIKPLNIRELHFYQNIPEDIQSFVPRYKGVMQASNTGSNKLDKRYSPCFREENGRKPSLGGKRKRDDVFKFKVHRNGNASEVIKSIAHMDNSNKQCEISCLCHQALSIGKNTSVNDFLMMENITSSFRRPCVLDLKMGTRQHGDDASAEKRSKQIAKCAASTSATLGVRLCGMQVWNTTTGACIRRDKYWGRSLTEAGLKDALIEFFSAGGGKVVRYALKRLAALRRAVAKQTSYRFYSCSLLIVYEGDVSAPLSSSSSSCSGSSDDGHFDMSTLHTQITAPLPPCEDARAGYECDEAEGGIPADTSDGTDGSAADSADSWHAYCSSSSRKRRRNDQENAVDIRMIDFAHTAYSEAAAESPLATATLHRGPDPGFLTGVDSLTNLLTQILNS